SVRRPAHRDVLGLELSSLYRTIFLRPLTRRLEVEVAVCGSYTRWLAETWRQGRSRLRWVVVPPVLSLDKALEEIHVGQEHGACGVFIRAVEGDRRLSGTYFYSLYREGARCDRPICIPTRGRHVRG